MNFYFRKKIKKKHYDKEISMPPLAECNECSQILRETGVQSHV